MHSRDVTFNDADFVSRAVAGTKPVSGTVLLPGGDHAAAASVQHEEAIQGLTGGSPQTPQTPSRIEAPVATDTPDQQYFDSDDDAWKLGGTPQPRPRPSYQGMHVTESAKVFIGKVNQSISMKDNQRATALLQEALTSFTQKGQIDYGSIINACYMLAQASTKDMNWAQALRSEDKDAVIEALSSEMDSLEASILEELQLGHPDYEEATREAISGRYLLDKRRSGQYKARGVKQGFKEDKLVADGPGFSYYSHMAKLAVVRMLLFRRGRGSRNPCIKDVCTAFLQSNRFPDSIRKFSKLWNPFTGRTKYYRQHGPIYGEASAPIRWEETLAPELETAGFHRGENQPTCFLHELQDLVALIYVDDGLADGEHYPE